MSNARDELAEALAQIAPLDIPELYAPGVAFWLRVLKSHIATFEAVELPDTVEPAPIFRP
jgi:hypothetical protein